MDRFTKYRVSRLFAPLLVCVYIMMVAVEHKSKSNEIFPFFNWSLFSSISSLKTVPALRLHSINGRTLPSPRLYFDMGETFVLARQRDVNCWKTVLALVDALRADDKEKVGRMRRLIEQRYMAEAGQAEYDVVMLTYEPIHRLRTGEIEDIAVLASYTKIPQ